MGSVDSPLKKLDYGQIDGESLGGGERGGWGAKVRVGGTQRDFPFKMREKLSVVMCQELGSICRHGRAG